MTTLNVIGDKIDAMNSRWSAAVAVLAVVAAMIGSHYLASRPSDGNYKTPDSIPDWIPGVTSMYRYIFHNMEFIQHFISILDNRTIMKFRLGPKPVYFVSGTKNMQVILRNSSHLTADELFYMALRQLDGVAESDINKFKADRTGRSQIPAMPVPEGHDRIWYENHKIFAEYLTRPESLKAISTKFVDLLQQKVEKERGRGWKSVRIYEWLMEEMVECAIVSLSGSYILEMNPGLINAMWEMDKGFFALIMGMPKLFYSKPYHSRDAYLDMGERYELAAHEKFDWQGPDADKEWEPIFGSRFSRIHSKFLADRDFKPRSRAGMHLGTIWALNANSIPVTTWVFVELIKDATLLTAVRAEAESAFEVDPASGMRKLDLLKLARLPLLQSIYIETLRMHVSVNLTREVAKDMPLDGYMLKKGYLVQAPSMIAHFDEEVWGAENHPASVFWAKRHIIYVDEVDESGNTKKVKKFSVASKGGNLMAYGGGVSICPGRHFAKQEIMAAIAILVVNLDIEFEEWVQMDGAKSDREPLDNQSYCGVVAMPPDRDARVRWRAR